MNNFFKRLLDNNPLFFGLLFTVSFIACIVIITNKLKGKDKTAIIEEEYVPLTPRHMKGIDTIRADDSLYIIRFTIDTVIPNNIQNESQDKYEEDYETR